jgi:hypothetical protein
METKKKFLAAVLFFSLIFGGGQYSAAQVLPQDSLSLVALYDSTNGANWTDNTNWLGGPVSTWYGITVSGNRVSRILLDSNNLNGTIPFSLENISNLTHLHLRYNQLSGNIPTQLSNLSNLQYLRLNNNQLSGNIPPELGNLSNLSYLYLNSNNLNGSIPVELGNLSQLQRLYLSSNQLTGNIPPQLGNLSNMREFLLGSNQFSGAIPSELGNLSNVKYLWLENNQLSDSIPTELGNLTGLQELLLYDNQLVNMPDYSSSSMSSSVLELQVQNNQLTFEDIESNVGIAPTFYYSPQDSVGTETDTTVDAGSSFTFTVEVAGTANQYQWMKDEVDISGADSSSYIIFPVDTLDSGSYICKITNTIAAELTLYSRPVNLTVKGSVGIAGDEYKVPQAFALHQNYPNPFNPSTTIKYDLPKSCKVVLKIYNALGQEVNMLVNEIQAAGFKSVQWDGKNRQGQSLGSGIYIYKIEVQGYTQSRKLMYIK